MRSIGTWIMVCVLGAAACGEDEGEVQGDTSHGDSAGPDVTTADIVGADASGPPPAWSDPIFVEPAPPSSAELEAVLEDQRTAVEGRLDGAAVAALEGVAATHGSRVGAFAQAASLRLDAAAWLLLEDAATPQRPEALASLAALAMLASDDPARFADAAVLARGALALIGEVADDAPVTRRRLAAAAWSNLGRARLGTGEAAGAIAAYRHAARAFPRDPAYATGLAAALAQADLLVPAYAQALAAAAREVWAEPSAGAGASTPAGAWVEHLAARLATRFPIPPGALDAPRGGAAPRFPAVGSELLGLVVLAASDDGIIMSAPRFEAHGDGHLAGPPPACEIAPNGTVAKLTCPSVPGQVFHKSWSVITPELNVATPRVSEPGLTCDNALERLFSPEVRAMEVRPFGLPDAAASHAAGLGLALQGELAAVEASLGMPDELIEMVEMCSDFSGSASRWQTNADLVADKCPLCLCSSGEDCGGCWQDYADACGELYEMASELGAREERRALVDDDVHRRNMDAYFAMMPALTALAQDRASCDGACAEGLAGDLHWQWLSQIGGRHPGFLALARDNPAIAYLTCLREIPRPCPAASGGQPGDDPSKVPCICVGAGPVSYCLQADGLVSVELDAGIALGASVSLAEGLSSLRLGVGLGVGAELGPVSAGISYMAWFDPTRGTFAGHDVSADVSLGLPGGGDVGSTFLCDAWRSDAPEREADDADLWLEATAPGPE